jgi:hypothetical protein
MKLKERFATLIAILLVVFSAGFAEAQWRFNAYGGYGLDDEVQYTASDGKLFKANVNSTVFYGGGFEYVFRNDYGVEVLYFREDTEVPVDYSYGEGSDSSISPGIGINMVMVSGNAYKKIEDSPLEPFGSVLIGLMIFNNKDPLPGSETTSTKFAYGFRAGLNIWASDAVGIKLMGQLVSAVQAFDGGFYLGTGGIESGLDPESSMLQFGLGGGLIYRF